MKLQVFLTILSKKGEIPSHALSTATSCKLCQLSASFIPYSFLAIPALSAISRIYSVIIFI